MTLGERIKNIRKSHNMTQAELADAINKSRPSIAAYELNDRMPDIDTLVAISKYFNVSTDYLLCLSDTIYENEEQARKARKSLHDIEKLLLETQKMLQEDTDLTLQGKPAAPEAIQSIIDGINLSLEMAKKRNK